MVKTTINPHQSFLFKLDELRNDMRIDPILNQIKERVKTSIMDNDNHCTLRRWGRNIIIDALHLTSDPINLPVL